MNFYKNSNEEEIIYNWGERERFKMRRARKSLTEINKISYNRQGERDHVKYA